MIKRIFFLIFFSWTLSQSSFAQSLTNFSGLRNTELEKYQCDGADAVSEIRTQLPGQGLPAFGSQAMPGATRTAIPKVERVSIIEDRSSQVTGEIYFNGFDGGGSLRVFVSNDKGNEQKEIPAQVIPISGTSGMLDLLLKLPDGTAENAYYKSSFLRMVYSPSSHGAGKTFCFKMNKRWRVVPNNQNIVVKIQPVPYAKASTTADYAKMEKPGNPLKGANKQPTSTSEAARVRKDTLIEAEGISNITFSLFEDFYTDYAFTNPNEISSIQLDAVYQDKNVNSGVYYYRPAAYNLSWGENEGFKFSMQYGSGGSSNDGNVNMTASLSCDINSQESDFITSVIKNHVESKNKHFEEAKAILPSDPKISFQGNAQSFNISSDKFSANVVSSIYEPITMAWTASSDATNEMIAALGENIGIAGSLTYSPGIGVSNMSIPMRLNLADKSSFGRLKLEKETWRETKWRNKFPYAIKIKNLHVIILHPDGSPCIYTWKLGDKTIPSQAQIQFEGASVPTWIDNNENVLRMWMEYEVLPCKECDQEIVDMISSGTTGGKQRTVSFRSLGLLNRYEAKYIKLEIRSKYLDPKGKTTLIKSITIDQDEKTYDVGPFYVWSDKELRYEYKLTLINDETSVEGANWIGENSMEVMMNKSAAEKSLGNNLPAKKN
jgi:hypothetical protein